jgi:glutaredoxin
MFCAQVAALLRDAEIPFRTIDVPERQAQDALCARYNAIAFPLVLVDREYLGGFTHMVRLHSQGRLKAIVSYDEQDRPDKEPGPARQRLRSSADLTSDARRSTPVPAPLVPAPGAPVPAVPASGVPAPGGATLADFAKLGEYLQRTKKG